MLTCQLEEKYASLEVEEEAATHIKEGSFKEQNLLSCTSRSAL